MGGVLGIVFTDVGLRDLNTGEILLQKLGDKIHADVLCKNIIGGGDDVANLYFIANACDYARFLGGIVVVDTEVFTESRHKLDRRCC